MAENRNENTEFDNVHLLLLLLLFVLDPVHVIKTQHRVPEAFARGHVQNSDQSFQELGVQLHWTPLSRSFCGQGKRFERNDHQRKTYKNMLSLLIDMHASKLSPQQFLDAGCPGLF